MDPLTSEKFSDEHVHVEAINIANCPTQEVVFTDHESKLVRRKLDFWIMPILMISYALQYWDKSLQGQAAAFNFTKDLGLVKVIGHTSKGVAITSTKRFANATLIFYVGYLVSSYPATLLTQRLPTAKVCAGAVFLWSIIIMCTPACKSYEGLMINRFFLGCMESFIAPSFLVYVTFWWKRNEQSLRMSLWWGMNGVALMITPLISWGLGHINGPFGASTWKYMFLCAGGITMLWSLVILIVLPDNPSTAKWLTERERSIVLARIKENNSGMVNTTFKRKQALQALLSFNMWSNAFVNGSAGIPNAVFSSFGVLIISDFGYSKFTSLLLLMPLGFTAAFSVYVTGYICQRFKNMRYILLMICSAISLTGSLVAWLTPRDRPSVLYAGVVLMAFIVGSSAISVGLTAANCAGHTKKSTTSGMIFIGYCVGNIIGPICFSSTPGPIYYGGFVSCIVVNAGDFIIAVYGWWWYTRKNRLRDDKYGVSTTINGLEDLSDDENKDFRYVL